jgi:hypothetical protein
VSPLLRFFLALQLLLLVVGLVWMGVAGYAVIGALNPTRDLLAFGTLLVGMFGLERLFSALFPTSFKATEALHSQMGRIMRESGMNHHQALALSVASGLGEEFFFRGALQNAFGAGLVAVAIQALVFAIMHPVPDRKAWSYPAFVFCGGLLFGLTYLYTGSLIPGILAHYLHNARGFYELLNAENREPKV